MRYLLSSLCAAILSLVFLGGAARAQEIFVVDPYDDYLPPYAAEIVVVPPPPPPPVVVEVPEPAPVRVYGWVAERPRSCGEFRYWDGTRCLDARYDPPYTGPRW